MKEDRNFLVIILIVLMIAIGAWTILQVYGCASTQQTGISGAYLARKTLNNYWENYLNFRDTLSGNQKMALMEKFKDTGKTSVFTEAKEALDTWNAAIGLASEIKAQESYQALFNKIFALLLSNKIIEVEI